MAATYPSTPLQEAICTVEQMRAAWDAGYDAGYDAATSYYAKGGSFK